MEDVGFQAKPPQPNLRVAEKALADTLDAPAGMSRYCKLLLSTLKDRQL
jgi:hypothetical protein